MGKIAHINRSSIKRSFKLSGALVLLCTLRLGLNSAPIKAGGACAAHTSPRKKASNNCASAEAPHNKTAAHTSPRKKNAAAQFSAAAFFKINCN